MTEVSTETVLKELGVAGTVILELAWLTPWFRYFNASAGSMTEAGVLGILYAPALVTMLVERGLTARRTRSSVRWACLVLLLLAQTATLMLVFHPAYPGLGWRAFISRAVGSLWDMLEVVPAEIVIVLATLFVFRRGILAAGEDALAPDKVHFRFRLGIVILAAFGLIFRNGEGRLMLDALPAYFGAGMVALAVSRIRQSPIHAGSGSSPNQTAWILTILTVILATVGLAQGVSNLLQSRAVGEAMRILGVAALEVLRVIVLLLSPLIEVTGVFMAWLVRTMAGALGGGEAVARVVGGIESLTQTPPTAQPSLPLWIQVHARELAGVATGMILALLAFTAIRGGRKGDGATERGAADEVEGLPVVLADLKEERSLLDEPGRRRRRSLGAFGEILAADSIRRIYGRLLRLAAERGRPRAPAETPLEYLPVLCQIFSLHQDEVSAITHAYLRVRYGGRPDEDAGLTRVKQAWASIQAGT